MERTRLAVRMARVTRTSGNSSGETPGFFFFRSRGSSILFGVGTLVLVERLSLRLSLSLLSLLDDVCLDSGLPQANGFVIRRLSDVMLQLRISWEALRLFFAELIP